MDEPQRERYYWKAFPKFLTLVLRINDTAPDFTAEEDARQRFPESWSRSVTYFRVVAQPN